MKKKITLTIDGKKVEADAGSNLLQVARDNGFDIPGLCYHKKLSPTGACRLCVTKIEGMRGMTMSCTVQVQDGMSVIAFDEELEKNRKHTLDYLLSEHNDNQQYTKRDELWDLAVKYGLDDEKNRKYPSVWKQMNYPVDDSSPVLTYDASKCIKCFRCIKACDEVQGKNILNFADRGLGSYIIAGFDHWAGSECDGCGECIQLCPTEAIVEKPHADKIDIRNSIEKITTTLSVLWCRLPARIMG